MAAEEDKKFNAVLGGFLVNDMRIRAGDLHCPESDTLAAYHERSLLPEEMDSWKEHIVGCARCQTILAELEATDSVSLNASEREEVLTEAARTAVAASEVSPPQIEGRATLPAKSRVTPISRVVRWQWLAPAGALAAGLLVWVAWHENRSQLKAPTEIKTARLEPPAAAPITRDDRLAASAEESARISKDQGAAAGGAAAAKSLPEAGGLKQLEKPDARGRVASPEPLTDKHAGARADTVLDSTANRAQSQTARDAKAGVAGAMSQTVEVQELAANAQPQNQQGQQNLQAQLSQLNEQKTSGPNPSRHLETKKSKAEAPASSPGAAAPPPPAPVAAFSDSVRPASTLMAGGLAQQLISAPGGKSLWRVSHLGMIEFSSNSGTSWLRQTSNVSVDLTAGSAPSDKICWIVGRAGTILLTADAGAHWVTIHSPLNEDLGGVRAADALHATIWNLDKTRLLETFDAGATWKPAVSQ